MNKRKIITWALFFLIFFLILQIFQSKSTPSVETTAAPVVLESSSNDYASGSDVSVTVYNNTEAPIIIPSACPSNPLKVLVQKNGVFEERTTKSSINCELASEITVPAHDKKSVAFTYWNFALFGEPGRYAVELSIPQGKKPALTYRSAEFTVSEIGLWRKIYRVGLQQPLYNTLIAIVSVVPMHDLGLAVIVLTVLIRLILLVPSQRAITSQRRMQELQPKLEEVRKKYAGNQERIASETMLLWKQNKVNPFGSCLPLIVQFPVLIALFYVIRSGLNPDNVYMLYAPLKSFNLADIHTNFFGIMNLTRANTFILPLIIGALQFLQMKLTFLKKQQSNAGKESKPSEMETANKSMTYVMPVMIALFTASVPAGVGLYWGVSTLFGIGQQLIANRKPAHA